MYRDRSALSPFSHSWCILEVDDLPFNFFLGQGAFWGLMICLVVGLIRMVLDFTMPAPFCGSGEADTRPAVLTKVHFFHFAIILSAISVISTVVISLFTEPRPPEKVWLFAYLCKFLNANYIVAIQNALRLSKAETVTKLRAF